MKRFLGVFFALVLVLALVLIPTNVAFAASIIHVDADAIGANDGSSWTDAYTDLQDALGVASSGDEIWVAAGTYKPTSSADRTVTFQLKPGVTLYGGFDGTETAREQRDWATNVTILSGDIGTPGDNSDNTYHMVVGANNATLDGFTVTDGNANGTGNDTRGSGMLNWNSSPTVINCTLSGNSAWDAGGGIFNWNSSATVTNCTLSGNSAGWGGGMHNWESSPTVTACTFSGNSASNGGGAMHNHDYSSPTVGNCIFWSNSSTMGWGGGMHNDGDSSPTVTNCTFYGNSGGGVNNWDSSPIVTNCILWGNGYEIANDGTSTPLVTYCDVQGGYPGGNIDADPMFADALGGDYHLLIGSPCIDTGDNNAPSLPATDFEGDPRILPVGGDVDMGADEYVPSAVEVEATLDFNPNTLNVRSKGKWITCYIELEAGYDVNDIDVTTILLNDTVSAELKPATIGDYDSDGVPDLMVKFNRALVQELLTAGNEVEVTVSGELTDGTPFECTDTIRVIAKGKK